MHTPSFADWASIALFLQIANASNTSSSATACSSLVDAQASFLAQYPNATVPRLPAEVVHQCVASIPVQKEFSITLIESLSYWLEFESQIEYLKDPKPGFVWDPFDAAKELERIYNDLQSDKYAGQFDLEVDLQSMFLHFRDFHTVFRGDINGRIFWLRGTEQTEFRLVSASVDGLATPKVYVATDLIQVDDGNNYSPSPINFGSISAISHIDNLNVQQFLQMQQLEAYSHDPDAMYNQLFQRIWGTTNPVGDAGDTFSTPVFYPGATTVLKFENGSSIDLPNLAGTVCLVENISSGQEYWDSCHAPREENATTTSTPEGSAVHKMRRAETQQTSEPKFTKIYSHPMPVAIDELGLLSGYYLDDSDHQHVAVLVIRSFGGEERQDTYQSSFQAALETFLQKAKTDGKTQLIIDLQGNGGGFIVLATELLAQLFPSSRPDQKGNFRASDYMNVALRYYGYALDATNAMSENITNANLINELGTAYAWQALMTPDGAEFKSFDDLYGPVNLGGEGNYTAFFQGNYTNSMPEEIYSAAFEVTGYGERAYSGDPPPPPFDPKNVVILADGNCGSSCTIASEMLINMHSIPAIVFGGRPVTGPMQPQGNTKGSQVWSSAALEANYVAYITYLSVLEAYGQNISSYPHLDDIALKHGLRAVNNKNNYRIGDDSETVLQMVYSAADCKAWYTHEMLYDPIAVWKRVAEIAFDPTRSEFGAGGGPYTSQYCVEGSTGHPTSVTGGLMKGSLGPQTPPENAYPQYYGWLKDGYEIVKGFSLVSQAGAGLGTGTGASHTDSTGTSSGSNSSSSSANDNDTLTSAEVQAGLADLRSACNGYSGTMWLFSLICGKFG